MSKLHLGDCMDVMSSMPDNSIDAIITDPPYGLAFMGARWDSFGGSTGKETIDERRRKMNEYLGVNAAVPAFASSHGHTPKLSEMHEFQAAMTPIFEEALRVAKPGAHLLCFGGTRTFHRMTCAIEDAGWEIRDCIMWVYGCLDEDTEVLVDGEFVRYNKAKKGSLALGYDIESGTFSWQQIEDTYLYDYDDTAYAIQSDCTDQLVSRNHRCIVERGGVEQFAFAEQVAQEREASVPVLEGLHGLLDRLPLPDERAGGAEQDVLEGVRCESRGSGTEEAQGSRAEQDLPRVRKEVLRTASMAEEGKDELLLSELQEQGRVRSKIAGAQQGEPNANVRRTEAGAQRANDRLAESRMEGRCDVSKTPRELREREVRQMPQGVRVDGSQGRLRDGASACGGEGDRQAARSDRGRASHQPRSAGQQTRELDAVPDEQGAQALRSAWGAKTTLARVTPVHYEGKMWCIKVATGAFVARRHGKIFITGNSGFPKSMDVAKAIDKQRKDDPRPVCRYLRDAIERSDETTATIAEKFGFNRRMVEHWAARDTDSQPTVPTIEQWALLKDILGLDSSMDAEVERLNGRKGEFGDDYKNADIVGTYKGDTPGLAGERFSHNDNLIRAPYSNAAKQWDGWGTCLKPAWEPIIVARKPLDGTVAHNVLTWGVGALNIDACRVPTGDNLNGGAYCGEQRDNGRSVYGKSNNGVGEYKQPSGRFPANLVHDGSQMVLDLFPQSKGQQGDVTGNEPSRTGDNGIYGHYGPRSECIARNDFGSAARFFYCAKASKKDRGEGNNHPTVKPTALMEWLVKLVTPEGATVLDPFMGSGTTGVACANLGRRFVGIEREWEYMRIAGPRIADREREFGTYEPA